MKAREVKMDKDYLLEEIIKTCLLMDSRAARIYDDFARREKNEELRAFWQEMHEEEKMHVGCWRYLLNLSEKGLVPQIFDDPDRVRRDLDKTQSKIDALLERGGKIESVSDSFIVAFRLEFYMLDAAFADLFRLIQFLSEEHRAFDDYDKHLSKFIDALYRYSETPELELLGETLQRTWKQNKDLVIQATTDYLTGVFNRRGIFQTIAPLAYMAQRKANKVGIVMIDIDNFKEINDTHGHQEGDEVLKFVANSIRTHVRRSDIVGRYGGEEFLVYLSEVDPAHLRDISEKIRRRIETESKARLPITVSIGVSQKMLGEDVKKELYGLIKQADKCMYRAKHDGKNKVVIGP